MKLIYDWAEQKHKCYICGDMRSVKYKSTIIDPSEGVKPIQVYLCNRCILLNRNKLPIIRNYKEK